MPIAVFEEKGGRLALLPDGRVLSSPTGAGAPRVITLPVLPAGFRYTDLAKEGNLLVVPWEEVSFTDIGRAGLLIYPVPG